MFDHDLLTCQERKLLCVGSVGKFSSGKDQYWFCSKPIQHALREQCLASFLDGLLFAVQFNSQSKFEISLLQAEQTASALVISANEALDGNLNQCLRFM